MTMVLKLISNGPVIVEVLPCGDEYRLIQPYTVVVDGKTIIVPKGFITDFASVPRLFWRLFPPFGKYTPAAVLHDYLCRKPGFSRAEADKIFLHHMESLGVPFYKRYPMYLGVRTGALVRGKK
jgi:hypothetical protein